MNKKDLLEELKKNLPEGLAFEDIHARVPEALWRANQEAAAIAALRGIFDASAYLRRYADVAEAGVAPLEHYVRHGVWESRVFTCRAQAAFCGNVAQSALPEKTRPKVSVIVPVYNNGRFLRECFDSLIGQSLKDLEIIIIDDGSTEAEALDIMAEYEKKDTRITVIHKKNTGYGHTMNAGLDRASGKYVGFLESDDYMAMDAFAYMYDVCEQHSLDYIKTDFIRFYGGLKEKRSFQKLTVLAEDENKYDKVLDSWSDTRTYTRLNVIWNGLYNLDFINKYKIRFHETPGASFQDNGFWFLTYIFGRRFMLTHKHTYHLRRDNIQSSVFDRSKGYAMVNEFKYIENKLKEYHLYDRFKFLFVLKKFETYEFMLRFVDKMFIEDLFKIYVHEFSKAQAKGEISKKYFDKEYIEVCKYVEGRFLDIEVKRPDVSIIMPVYNAEKYIEECMKSLLSQTMKEIEIICIDDGSTDNSNPILRKMAFADKRIKLFWQENAGAGNARNVGMKNAIGDYIFFLDADDIFAPTLVEDMLKTIRETDADFCVCKSESLNDQTGKTFQMWYSVNQAHRPIKKVFAPEEIKGEIFRLFVGWPWDKVYKKQFIDKNNLKFQELSCTNDLLFVYSALVSAQRISICDKTLVKHRERNPYSISNMREKNPDNFIIALRALKKYMQSKNIYCKFYRSFISYCVRLYNWQFKTLLGLSALNIAKKRERFIMEFDIDKLPVQLFYDPEEWKIFNEIHAD